MSTEDKCWWFSRVKCSVQLQPYEFQQNSIKANGLVSSSSFRLRRSVCLVLLERHHKILAPFRLFRRNLSYFEGFLSRKYNVRRNFNEIFRIWRAWSKRWPDLLFLDDKAVGMVAYRHVVSACGYKWGNIFLV